MRLFQLTAPAVLATMLVACSGGATPAAHLTAHPLYGVLTAQEAALVGNDADVDGVRDDFQLHLETAHPDADARDAVLSLGRALTRITLQGSRGQRPTSAQLEHFWASWSCYWHVAGDAKLSTGTLHAAFMSTPEREQAYRRHSELAAGVPTQVSLGAAACATVKRPVSW